MQLILLVSFPNCVLLQQVLQQVFHHHIFYSSPYLSLVFSFSKVFLECITFHLLTAKSTEHSLCSFSLRQLFSFRCQVFLLERNRQREKERESGKERSRGNSIAKQKMLLLGRQLLQEESSQWKSCCCCCSPSSYTFSTSPPPLLPPPPPPLCMSIKTKFK